MTQVGLRFLFFALRAGGSPDFDSFLSQNHQSVPSGRRKHGQRHHGTMTTVDTMCSLCDQWLRIGCSLLHNSSNRFCVKGRCSGGWETYHIQYIRRRKLRHPRSTECTKFYNPPNLPSLTQTNYWFILEFPLGRGSLTPVNPFYEFI